MPYCHNCEKHFHALGIMRHRAMHRDRKENCTITMKSGVFEYQYAQKELPLIADRIGK